MFAQHPLSKVLLNFFQKIATSKGRALGRAPQSAKLLCVRKRTAVRASP